MIPTLQADGYKVIAAQYGLDTNLDDVETVRRTISRVGGPVLLAGHSYGGTVITAAGIDDRVAGLVYICALGPDETESSQGQIDKFPLTPVFSHVEVADGRLWLLPEGTKNFCGDLSEEEQALVWATHYAPDADLFNHNAPGVAWRDKPSWWVLGTQDQTVNPELQKFASERMGATVCPVDSSHVPMLSHPDFVIDVIRQAAKAIEESSVKAGVA